MQTHLAGEIVCAVSYAAESGTLFPLKASLPHRIVWERAAPGVPPVLVAFNCLGQRLGILATEQHAAASEAKRKLANPPGGLLFSYPYPVAELAGTAPWSSPQALESYMRKLGPLL